MCVATVVVRLARVGREVQRAHGCVASSWRAWCSGDLGDGWAEVLLSEQSQVSESLAEECEAVGEARPPCRVARIGGFIGAATGVFCRSNARAEGSTIVCVRLENSSCSGLQRAAFLAWHNIGDGVFFDGLLSASLPDGGGGVKLCCVVYASTHY